MMAFTKIIVMVPIWKCVGLTLIWSNFSMFIIFIHIFFKISTIVLLIQQSPHRGIDNDSVNWNQIRP